MKLVVFSHKLLWRNPETETGFATDGGFAFHMDYVSQIFDSTIVAAPVNDVRKPQGEVAMRGHNLSIYALSNIKGAGFTRKLRYILWFFKNIFIFNRLINNADAVHVPIPSDIGTLGMLLAWIKGKPLYVRHCGNWLVQKTAAERFWKWFMEKYAGGRNVMLTTGLQDTIPSEKNANIKWVFSSSVTTQELEALGKVKPQFTPDSPRLIIVCRMEEEKGVGRVIKAMATLKPNYPSIHLDVVGDGPALTSFKNLAESLSLQNNITFHGKLDHDGVLKALSASQLFCYPTTASEGFPKVVLEAMASGLVVLGTPVSAIKKLLSGHSGVILENESPEVLSAALESIIKSTEDYTLMQNNALAKAKEFSLEKWRDTIKGHLTRAWKLS